MCRLIRRFSFCLLVATALVAVAPWFVQSVSAQVSSRAGLVVVHGDGRQSFAIVQFEGDSIPVVDVLGRSGLEVTELNFGALGVGVCAIEGTGCDVATCRKRVCQGPQPDDPYWQLFIPTDVGGWRYAPLGISSESLSDGDVRALVWTGTEPELPMYSSGDVAAKAGSIGENGVALTRYDAEGRIAARDEDGASSIPLAGLAAVALAAVLAMTLVVRRRGGSR